MKNLLLLSLFSVCIYHVSAHAEIRGSFISNVQNKQGTTQAERDALNKEMQIIGHETLMKLQLLYLRYAHTIEPNYPILTLVCNTIEIPAK